MNQAQREALTEDIPGYMNGKVSVVDADMRTIHYVLETDGEIPRDQRENHADLLWGYVMNTVEEVRVVSQRVDEGYEIMVMGTVDRMEP